MAEATEIDFDAFRAKELTAAREDFVQWYIDQTGVQFSKVQADAFREGVKAFSLLNGIFTSSDAGKAAAEARKSARAAAVKPKAEKAPAKKVAAKAGGKKAKPAGASDLI
jgi:hypothetical protein